MAETCKRKFWIGVLNQADKDIQGHGTDDCCFKYIFMEASMACFCTSDQGVVSLLWICTALDLDPIIVPTLVANMENEQSKFNA